MPVRRSGTALLGSPRGSTANPASASGSGFTEMRELSSIRARGRECNGGDGTAAAAGSSCRPRAFTTALGVGQRDSHEPHCIPLMRSSLNLELQLAQPLAQPRGAGNGACAHAPGSGSRPCESASAIEAAAAARPPAWDTGAGASASNAGARSHSSCSSSDSFYPASAAGSSSNRFKDLLPTAAVQPLPGPVSSWWDQGLSKARLCATAAVSAAAAAAAAAATVTVRPASLGDMQPDAWTVAAAVAVLLSMAMVAMLLLQPAQGCFRPSSQQLELQQPLAQRQRKKHQCRRQRQARQRNTQQQRERYIGAAAPCPDPPVQGASSAGPAALTVISTGSSAAPAALTVISTGSSAGPAALTVISTGSWPKPAIRASDYDGVRRIVQRQAVVMPRQVHRRQPTCLYRSPLCCSIVAVKVHSSDNAAEVPGYEAAVKRAVYMELQRMAHRTPRSTASWDRDRRRNQGLYGDGCTRRGYVSPAIWNGGDSQLGVQLLGSVRGCVLVLARLSRLLLGGPGGGRAGAGPWSCTMVQADDDNQMTRLPLGMIMGGEGGSTGGGSSKRAGQQQGAGVGAGDADGTAGSTVATAAVAAEGASGDARRAAAAPADLAALMQPGAASTPAHAQAAGGSTDDPSEALASGAAPAASPAAPEAVAGGDQVVLARASSSPDPAASSSPASTASLSAWPTSPESLHEEATPTTAAAGVSSVGPAVVFNGGASTAEAVAQVLAGELLAGQPAHAAHVHHDPLHAVAGPPTAAGSSEPAAATGSTLAVGLTGAESHQGNADCFPAAPEHALAAHVAAVTGMEVTVEVVDEAPGGAVPPGMAGAAVAAAPGRAAGWQAGRSADTGVRVLHLSPPYLHLQQHVAPHHVTAPDLLRMLLPDHQQQVLLQLEGPPGATAVRAAGVLLRAGAPDKVVFDTCLQLQPQPQRLQDLQLCRNNARRVYNATLSVPSAACTTKGVICLLLLPAEDTRPLGLGTTALRQHYFDLMSIPCVGAVAAATPDPPASAAAPPLAPAPATAPEVPYDVGIYSCLQGQAHEQAEARIQAGVGAPATGAAAAGRDAAAGSSAGGAATAGAAAGAGGAATAGVDFHLIYECATLLVLQAPEAAEVELLWQRMLQECRSHAAQAGDEGSEDYEVDQAAEILGVSRSSAVIPKVAAWRGHFRSLCGDLGLLLMCCNPAGRAITQLRRSPLPRTFLGSRGGMGDIAPAGPHASSSSATPSPAGSPSGTEALPLCSLVDPAVSHQADFVCTALASYFQEMMELGVYLPHLAALVLAARFHLNMDLSASSNESTPCASPLSMGRTTMEFSFSPPHQGLLSGRPSIDVSFAEAPAPEGTAAGGPASAAAADFAAARKLLLPQHRHRHRQQQQQLTGEEQVLFPSLHGAQTRQQPGTAPASSRVLAPTRQALKAVVYGFEPSHVEADYVHQYASRLVSRYDWLVLLLFIAISCIPAAHALAKDGLLARGTALAALRPMLWLLLYGGTLIMVLEYQGRHLDRWRFKLANACCYLEGSIVVAAMALVPFGQNHHWHWNVALLRPLVAKVPVRQLALPQLMVVAADAVHWWRGASGASGNPWQNVWVSLGLALIESTVGLLLLVVQDLMDRRAFIGSSQQQQQQQQQQQGPAGKQQQGPAGE